MEGNTARVRCEWKMLSSGEAKSEESRLAALVGQGRSRWAGSKSSSP